MPYSYIRSDNLITPTPPGNEYNILNCLCEYNYSLLGSCGLDFVAWISFGTSIGF